MNHKFLKIALLSCVALGISSCDEGKYKDLKCDDTYKTQCLNLASYMACENGTLIVSQCGDNQYCKTGDDGIGACIDYDQSNGNNNNEPQITVTASQNAVSLTNKDAEAVDVEVTLAAKDSETSVSGLKVSVSSSDAACATVAASEVTTDESGKATISVIGGNKIAACEAKLTLSAEGADDVELSVSVGASELIETLTANIAEISLDNDTGSESDIRQTFVNVVFATNNPETLLSDKIVNAVSDNEECIEFVDEPFTTDETGKAVITVKAVDDAADCKATVTFSIDGVAEEAEVVISVGTPAEDIVPTVSLSISPSSVALDNYTLEGEPSLSMSLLVVASTIPAEDSEEEATAIEDAVIDAVSSDDSCVVISTESEDPIVTDEFGTASVTVMTAEDAEDCAATVTISTEGALAVEIPVVVGTPAEEPGGEEPGGEEPGEEPGGEGSEP